jgi:DNA helicase-2/ATP-dependent DNA helicase PcrA
MPIIINDNNSATQVTNKGAKKKNSKAFSPAFFNGSVLTGRGGNSRGLLNDSKDPKHFINGYPAVVNPNLEMGKNYNGNTTIYNIPFYMIKPTSWDTYIKKFERPATSEMLKIATKGSKEIYMAMPIHAVQVEEIKTQQYVNYMATGSATITRNLSACFHLFLFSIEDASITEHEQVSRIQDIVKSGNLFQQDIVHNMFSALRNVASVLTAAGYTVDKVAMNDYVQNYSLYVEICKAAERWITQTDYFMADVFAKNAQAYCAGRNNYNNPWTGKWSLSEALTRLEKYNVPLNLFQTMYQKLKLYTTPDILTDICKSHLNLMLSDTLQHMDKNRASLKFCPNTNTSKLVTCPTDSPNQTAYPYSNEQRNAVASTSPLTLVQSGAGTGKSTIILGRIEHMIANGIDPKSILVLSFTNNAANHILDKNPDVNSMTIDKMMRLIYAENYPSHQLSSLSTIINSLEIYFNPNITPMTPAQEQFISEFKHVLQRLRDDMEYTKAMNFIEKHIDETIDALNGIEQTSLELQGIICYLKMDTLKEPAATQADHLIIDEVQDNSISQFVYSIKYTDKHQCSMYIVGDCSQTLYEFRASNPKALNVLESSGVFETYKLQTNYRSNQEILDFANIGLSNIEANQYAKIQLHANSLTPVTLASFKEAVSFSYQRMQNKSATSWDALFAHSIGVASRDYVTDKLNKGEQVTFLARKRSDIYAIEKYLLKQYPTVPVIDKTTGQPVLDANGNPKMQCVSIASLIPQRQYDNTIFSKFIARYWGNITYAPPMDILTSVARELYTQVPNIAYRKDVQKVQKSAQDTMNAFRQKYASRVTALESDVQASIITQSQMLDEIKKFMISFEIERNGINQAVMSSRNNEAKANENIANANFILSTIHSAKGLEFDNVVVYYDGGSETSMDEATKRMYYVALTRARKTEFVFAYDTLAKPKIGSDYDKIIKELEALQNAAPADSDFDDDEDDSDDSVPANSVTKSDESIA